MKGNMEKNNYDEYQITVRHRLAFWSLLLTFALIMINAFVKSRYDWAVPGVEAIVLIGVPTLFFATGAVFQNAYISRREKEPWLTAGLFGGLAFVEFISFLAGAGAGELVRDGRLYYGFTPLALFVFFGYLAAILTIKALLDRHKGEE